MNSNANPSPAHPARDRPVTGRRSRLLLIGAALVTVTVLAGTAGLNVMSDTAYTRFQEAGVLLTRADATDLKVTHRFDSSRAAAATLTAPTGQVVFGGKAVFDGGLLSELATARTALDTAAAKSAVARPTRQPVRTPATPADASTRTAALTGAADELARHTVTVSRANAAVVAAADTLRARVAAITATLPQAVDGVTRHHPDATADTVAALQAAAGEAKRDGGDPAGLVRFLAAADAVAASDAAAKQPVAVPGGGSVPVAGTPAGAPAEGGNRGGPAVPAPVTGPSTPPAQGGSTGGGGGVAAPPPVPGPEPESPNPEDHVRGANPSFRQIGCLDVVTYSQTTSNGGVVVVDVTYPYDRTVQKVGTGWKVTVYTCF